ncbi:hypothetical protein [Blastococcus sp. TF02A-30]|uniref:hypothetical protein n=1 Tax=Blastococcus sp. TF02A-30 TaxID=2250580 RepID=UPI000DEBE0CE|nr:hypothetical protein [Blastococcus sp. TF02A-30]RBY92752.1 hypothetical protein DQ241_01430 [Blastococcus sp. TF02A-30]
MDDDPVLRALADDDPRLSSMLRRGRPRRRAWWPLVPALPVAAFVLLPPTTAVGVLAVATVVLAPLAVL